MPLGFVDATLIRLADPATRDALFDGDALEQMLTAAYDVSLTPLDGPFAAMFDEVELGISTAPVATVEGAWAAAGGTPRIEARFQASGLGPAAAIRVDAAWRGKIVARTGAAAAPIVEVEVALPDTDIDAQIVAALGALPANPLVLEQERRTRLHARIQAALDQPDALAGAAFDRWLRAQGVTTASQMLERMRAGAVSNVTRIQFGEPAPVSVTPKAIPFAAVVLIRDVGFSVAGLVAESKAVQRLLAGTGLDVPALPGFRKRVPFVVVWLLPAAVFDDADWPGGNVPGDAGARRRARRVAAGGWLAREGIGLAVAG